MEHLTLTETEFFRLISNPDSRTGLRTAYDEFTQRVIQLCLIPPESGHPVHALSYAETELQYHEALQGRSHESELNLHVHKALAFVRKMLRFLAREYHPLPPSHMFTGEKTGAPPSDAPPICWTGSISDLVELLYGLDTLKCINGGETWSWWGASCTTTEEFVNLWKFTVKYLRDTKGVHNFIYAISPQMDSAKTVDDFYFRWPGDEWVDFVGMDCYQGINNAVFVTNLKAISKVSLAKLKPCGVTETGVEGFTATDYWTTNIHAPLTGRRVSMVVTWRNKYDPMESGTHYFSVFPGHPSERDFVKMYNQENSFFCSDLPDMYTPAENVTVL